MANRRRIYVNDDDYPGPPPYGSGLTGLSGLSFSGGGSGPPAAYAMPISANPNYYVQLSANPGTYLLDSGGPLASFVLPSTQLYLNASGLLVGQTVLQTNGAASFTAASSQYLSGTLASGISISGGSISLWVNFTNVVGSSAERVIELGVGTTTGISLFANNVPSMLVQVNGGNNSSAFTPSSTTWYHVAITWSGSGTSFYVNGNLIGASVAPTGPLAALGLGRITTFGQYLSGLIDSVGLYNAVLTPIQITALYNAGSGYAYSNLPSSLQVGLYEWFDLGEQPGVNRVGRVNRTSLVETNGPIALVAGVAKGPAIYTGDSVTPWDDLSANADNATQTTASNRQVLKLAQINGKPVLQQVSSTGFMTLTTPIALTGAFWLSMTGYRVQSTNWILGGGSADDSFIGYSATTFFIVNTSGTNVNTTLIDEATGPISLNVWRISTTACFVQVNGGSPISLGNFAGTINLAVPFASTFSGVAAYTATGNQIAELNVNNTDLATNNAAYVTSYNSYLQNKYLISP